MSDDEHSPSEFYYPEELEIDLHEIEEDTENEQDTAKKHSHIINDLLTSLALSLQGKYQTSVCFACTDLAALGPYCPDLGLIFFPAQTSRSVNNPLILTRAYIQ